MCLFKSAVHTVLSNFYLWTCCSRILWNIELAECFVLLSYDLICSARFLVCKAHTGFQKQHLRGIIIEKMNVLLCFNNSINESCSMWDLKSNIYFQRCEQFSGWSVRIVNGAHFLIYWLDFLFLSLSGFVSIRHLSGHVLTRCINSEAILHHIALASLSKYLQTLTLQTQLDSQTV